ncbi:hypothetical protein BGW41_007257 [Actinomortierella wolfii]|nr:hypothetical protein BGW41_007257 [Actinomortierella wolfii]
MSTVSLIDPTTLNPSFSGPDTNRRGPPLGRPAAIITRNDQEASVELLTSLLAHAKQYRLQMLALAKAAANFGHSLEKIAHCKTAVLENPTSSSASPSHQQRQDEELLGSSSPPQPTIGHSDTLYKQFEIPLLQHLDTHKSNIEASEAQYERSMREMSQKIKETEAASLQNGRKRQRDLLQFRQALMTLTQQVDELERIKIGYYFSNLESEQANLQLILQKTSTLVRAEVDIYERVANKGLNDPILELMSTQGPDPYCVYPTTDEFSSIFSILPSTPIIPTNAGISSGPTATQPEGILTSFYGYHETNPFSTSRTPTTTVPRDRHLFGEASSAESSASPLARVAHGTKGGALTSTSTATGTGMMNGPTTKTKDSGESAEIEKKTQSNRVDSPKPEDTIATATSTTTNNATARSHDETESTEDSKLLEYGDLSGKNADAATGIEDNHDRSGSNQAPDSQASSLRTDGLDLRGSAPHHRHYSSKTDYSPAPSLSTSTHSSLMRPYTLRSLSGSQQHMTLSSTPESYPTRNMIHIPQDSELLNNRDFSFSYDPTDLLNRRSHAGVRAGDEFINEFEGMERAPLSEYTINTTTISSLHEHSISHSSSADLSHTDSQETQALGDREQASSSTSLNLAGKQETDTGYTAFESSPPSSSHEEAEVSKGTSVLGNEKQEEIRPEMEDEEDPYLHSLEHESKTAQTNCRVSSREFDDGMPAFLSDEENEGDQIYGGPSRSSTRDDLEEETRSQKSLGSKRSSDTFRFTGFFRSNNNSTTDVVDRLLVQAN